MNKADQLARAFEVASLLARRNQIEVSREELDLLRRKAVALDAIERLKLTVECRTGLSPHVYRWLVRSFELRIDARGDTALEAIESAIAQQPQRDEGREGKAS